MGDKACEVYSAAQENGLFLSFHTGLHWHRIADYQPLLFDEVAWNFPRRISLFPRGAGCYLQQPSPRERSEARIRGLDEHYAGRQRSAGLLDSLG